MPTRPLREADLADLAIRREQEQDIPMTMPRLRRALSWGLSMAILLAVVGAAYWNKHTLLPSLDLAEEHVDASSPLTAGDQGVRNHWREAPSGSFRPMVPDPIPLSASGYVVAQRQASVASKGTGRLESLEVAVGDQVKEGQMLARLEHTDVDADLRRAQAKLGIAKAALANAEAELTDATLAYNRSKTLLAKQFVTQAEYDSAEARLHRAQAAVRSTKAGVLAASAEVQTSEAQVENTYIRAPFDGTVLKKFAEVGEVVAPLAASASSRGAVFLIADLTSLQVEAEISETMIGRIQAGQSTDITLDAMPGQPYRGEVVQILPTADRSKATVLVKVRFLGVRNPSCAACGAVPDPFSGILPEMSAKVVFLPTGTRQGG